MKINEIITEAVRQRLDPQCWKNKHKAGTKIKGGIRVNNCVPNEGVAEGLIDYAQRKLGLKWGKIGDVVNGSVVAEYLDSQDDSMDTNRYIKSKFKLINITANEAEKYREISDLNGWPSDTPLEKVKGWGIDNYKMDRIRKNDVTYQSLMKHTPVVSSRGFIINGNHRVARALEMGIDPIPILKELQQGVAEGYEESIPSILYHATYKPRLKSIGLTGLGAGGKRNWEDSKRGVVYLALDPYVAESYAETSNMVPDEWLDQIVILKISTAGLDPNKFGIDSNVQDNAGDTVEYHGVIPLKNISLYKQGVAEGRPTPKNNTVSPEFIADYIAKIHTGNTRADDEELLEWIYSFDSFKLVTKNLDSIETRYSGLNPNKVSEYDKRPNPPPIVIDGTNGWIIDGYHRANAAKKRGDKTIQVYVGQQGVAEGFYDSNPATYDLPRRILNVPELIRRGAIFVTYPHDTPGWETDAQEDWQLGLISLYNVAKGPAWSVEAKKYLKPKSYKNAEHSINSSAPNLGSDKLVYDGKYNQILWSIKKLGIPDNVAFLDKDKKGVAEDWNKINHHDKTDGLSQKAQGINPQVDETAAWRRKEGKSKSGGLNAKGVASYRRENPGSKLQTAVTTKPSKLKPGSKAAKRRKSFCARMGGMKGPMKKPNGKPTRKALALRKWNCESVEQMVDMILENMDHAKDNQAVPELKAALLAKKSTLQQASEDDVYDIIDTIMTRIAKSHGMSGQKLHSMWVKEYDQIPDTWIMK